MFPKNSQFPLKKFPTVNSSYLVTETIAFADGLRPFQQNCLNYKHDLNSPSPARGYNVQKLKKSNFFTVNCYDVTQIILR